MVIHPANLKHLMTTSLDAILGSQTCWKASFARVMIVEVCIGSDTIQKFPGVVAMTGMPQGPVFPSGLGSIRSEQDRDISWIATFKNNPSDQTILGPYETTVL